MPSNILRKAYKISFSILSRHQSISSLFVPPSDPQSTHFSTSIDKPQNYFSVFEFPANDAYGVSLLSNKRLNFSCGPILNNTRLLFSIQVVAEPSTFDGPTVYAIVSNQWTILDGSMAGSNDSFQPIPPTQLFEMTLRTTL
ncbi:hypothetical protein L2E82_11420 [Cichorium intybus]|uniref:Uncharacterized protein n=1 Tax=Cichorium intybus TaxID=13427 RepID=A0ACB9GEH4_CICIN|nr:hypothetical protein L2E82_11420 [Cichorium intybus]